MAKGNVHLSETKDVVMKRLEKFFGEKRWSTTRLDTNTGLLIVRTPASILSWGEHVEVRIRPDTKGSFVTVESRPVAQLVDWGRSKEDVDTVVAFLRSLAQDTNNEAVRRQ